MKIRIFINPSRARRWHIMLADRLVSMGHQVAFAFVEGGATLNPAIALLTALERVIYRKSGDFASKRIVFDLFAGLINDMSEPDVVINLTNRQTQHNCQTLMLLFDGSADETGAIAAILSGRAPFVSVVDDQGTVFEGLPAIERNQLLSSAFDFILIRCITIIVRAIVNIETQQPLLQPQPMPIAAPRIKTIQLLAFGADVLQRKIRAKLLRLMNRVDHENQDHWRIAWRKCDAQTPPTMQKGAWPDIQWNILKDDNKRFYADPFIFEYNNEHYLFCEEFPYATLKGVISCAKIAADGTIEQPKHVLERPFHLSYPFVFERDGVIWMIPETYSSGKIELYRAVQFPDKWAFEQVLVDNVVASDASLFEHNGLLWLFACDHDGGSSWDTLSLWYAKDLSGQWLPHCLNPVLVDARSARSGGKLVIVDGRIIRPVQNCVGGYGTGLVLKQITQLDEMNFNEHEIADLSPLPEWGMVGVHTLNSGAGIELIDQLGARSKPS